MSRRLDPYWIETYLAEGRTVIMASAAGMIQANYVHGSALGTGDWISIRFIPYKTQVLKPGVLFFDEYEDIG